VAFEAFLIFFEVLASKSKIIYLLWLNGFSAFISPKGVKMKEKFVNGVSV
jgi:hypothetical protein